MSSCLLLPIGKQDAAPLDWSQRLAWSLNVLRWSAGSGSGPVLWVTGRVWSLAFCSTPLPAMYISQGYLLYSVCGSVEHSSLFHFVAFFNFSWDFFFNPPPPPSPLPLSFLRTPSADWISNDIMHLAHWTPTSSKLICAFTTPSLDRQIFTLMPFSNNVQPFKNSPLLFIVTHAI